MASTDSEQKASGNDSQPWNDAVAVAGIIAVAMLAVFMAWFYGTGGETQASGMLGTVLPVIATIVGAVFGISAGTKAGSALNCWPFSI